MNVGSYDMETTPVAVALDDAMSAPPTGGFAENRTALPSAKQVFTCRTPAGSELESA